jgi:hypothetical protein
VPFPRWLKSGRRVLRAIPFGPRLCRKLLLHLTQLQPDTTLIAPILLCSLVDQLGEPALPQTPKCAEARQCAISATTGRVLSGLPQEAVQAGFWPFDLASPQAVIHLKALIKDISNRNSHHATRVARPTRGTRRGGSFRRARRGKAMQLQAIRQDRKPTSYYHPIELQRALTQAKRKPCLGEEEGGGPRAGEREAIQVHS